MTHKTLSMIGLDTIGDQSPERRVLRPVREMIADEPQVLGQRIDHVEADRLRVARGRRLGRIRHVDRQRMTVQSPRLLATAVLIAI